MESENIIAKLPYSKPFLFVDEIVAVDENSIVGKFTFSEDLDFFGGHFKDNPVVPGVIILETMAQIGVACLGVFLLDNTDEIPRIAMTSVEAEFLSPVYPREEIVVRSTKKYFRFNKLKCTVSAINSENKVVCNATISGMIIQ